MKAYLKQNTAIEFGNGKRKLALSKANPIKGELNDDGFFHFITRYGPARLPLNCFETIEDERGNS